MNRIAYVRVHLDANIPADMRGVVRCGSVVSEDEDGNTLKDHEELIDNSEFPSEEELIRHVAKVLGVSIETVHIES